MFCAECGSSTVDAKFCPECGTSVNGISNKRAQLAPIRGATEANKEAKTPTNSDSVVKALVFAAILLTVAIVFVLRIIPNIGSNPSSQDAESSNFLDPEASVVEEAKDSISNLSITQIDGRWPTMCQEVMGEGWSCWVDLKVTNNGSTPWSGNLTGELVSGNGTRSASTDSFEISELTGDFDVTLNPNTPMEWAVFFKVAPDQQFVSLDILSNGLVAESIPVCIGSSYESAMGC